MNYAFGNVQNGQCTVGEPEADYTMAYDAASSVDGVADAGTGALAGNFNQLRKLKRLHPNIEVLWSFGGWTCSGGSGQAAQNPAAFAESTGPAPGRFGPGTEDCNVLKTRCPATGTVAGTAYAKCGDEWWGYDTPATITGKMTYAKDQGLGGAFFWELRGDTADGELITAIGNGLR